MLAPHRLAATAAAALLIAAPVFAQGALVGVDDIDDRIDDIQEDVDDDFAEGEDPDRFRTGRFAPGFDGSVAAGLSASAGNTDTYDLTFGGRFRYGQGVTNQTFAFGGEFAADDGDQTEETIFATYDRNRYLNDDTYVFVLGSAVYDDFANNELDVFVGAGPGVRVINSPETTWRLQAGPGVRYVEEQNGDDSFDLAAIASSRYFYRFNPRAFVSNDTDIIFSDTNIVGINDLGVTYALTETISTRTSLRTQYTSDPLPGLEEFDSTLRASLVYSF